MAGRTAILKVDILSDFRGSGFAQAQSRLSGFAKSALGLAAGYIGVRKIVDGFQEVARAASDLQQSTAAIGTVFGEAGDIVVDFGTKAADAIGLSQSQFQQLGARTGALLINLGYDAESAASATNQLAQRAADLNAVFGVGTAQALDAINAGLRGEFDPLEQVGIKINETTVKAKAFELGLYSGKGALDANAKAQATYALVMEQSAYAAGQFAAESDTYAGATARLAAKWEDLKARIGATFLPAAANVVTWLADIAMPAVDRFIEQWGPKFDEWAVQAKAQLNAIGADIEAWWDAHGGRVLANVQTWWDAVYSYIDGILGALGDTIAAGLALIRGDFDEAGRLIGQAWSKLWRSVYNILDAAFGGIVRTAARWWTALWGTINQAIGLILISVTRFVNNITAKISNAGSQWWGAGSSSGRSLVLGMIAGISSASGGLFGVIAWLVQRAINTARAALGIASPSTVFADLGEQMAAGMAAGITAGAAKYVAPAVAGMTSTPTTGLLSGGRSTITVSGSVTPQDTARQLAGILSGARIRTGFAGIAA